MKLDASKPDNKDLVPILRSWMVARVRVSQEFYQRTAELMQNLSKSDPATYHSLNLGEAFEKVMGRSGGALYWDPGVFSRTLVDRLSTRSGDNSSEIIVRLITRSSNSSEITSSPNLTYEDVASVMRDILEEFEFSYKHYLLPGWLLARMLFFVQVLEKHLPNRRSSDVYEFFLRGVSPCTTAIMEFGYDFDGMLINALDVRRLISEDDILLIGKSNLAEGEALVESAKMSSDFDSFYSLLYLAYPYLRAGNLAYRLVLKSYELDQVLGREIPEIVGTRYLAQAVHSEEMYVRVACSIDERARYTEERLVDQLKAGAKEVFEMGGLYSLKMYLIEQIDVHLFYPLYMKGEILSQFVE